MKTQHIVGTTTDCWMGGLSGLVMREEPIMLTEAELNLEHYPARDFLPSRRSDAIYLGVAFGGLLVSGEKFTQSNTGPAYMISCCALSRFSISLPQRFDDRRVFLQRCFKTARGTRRDVIADSYLA